MPTIFESKYSIGDAVVVIGDTTVELPPEQCSACIGSGMCALGNESFQCPKCKGKKETQRTASGWVVINRGVVGKIECVTVTESDEVNWNIETIARHGVIYRYMFGRSGSGSAYFEDQLWPGDQAQAECDRRNAERFGPHITIKPYSRSW